MLGLQILRKIIDENSVVRFRRLPRELLLDALEQEAYDFIQGHLEQYRELPNISTLVERRITLNPAPEPYQYYLDNLVNRYKIQRYVQVGPEISEAYRSQDGTKLVDSTREYISSCDSLVRDDNVISMYEGFKTALDHSYEASMGRVRRWTIGYPGLDSISIGLSGGNLYSLMGIEGSGKTWILMNMMRKAAAQGAKCLFVSMEMSDQDMWPRLLGMEYRVNPLKFYRGELDSMLHQHLSERIEDFRDRHNIYSVSPKMKYRISDITGVVDEIEPDILFIDAPYTLRPTKVRKSNDDRRNTIGDVVEELKRISEEKQIPIVGTWQYNRMVSDKSDTADNRAVGESKIIVEQSSMVIGVLHDQQSSDRRVLMVTKNRFGKTGIKIPMHFDPDVMNFEEAEAFLSGQDSGDDGDDLLNMSMLD